MRRSPQKMWFAIVMMLTQLVINGAALAMPMAQAGTAAPAAATTSDCAEHSRHHVAAEQDNSALPSVELEQDDLEKDCCKQGGCACPCLHSGAAAPAIDGYTRRAFAELRVLAAVSALPHGRPNSLFRPPA